LKEGSIGADIATVCFEFARKGLQFSFWKPLFRPGSASDCQGRRWQEAAMTFGRSLFARLGWFTRKPAAPDAFDTRLARIGMREQRCTARPVLFRARAEALEA